MLKNMLDKISIRNLSKRLTFLSDAFSSSVIESPPFGLVFADLLSIEHF